jgi:hypothetical protein
LYYGGSIAAQISGIAFAAATLWGFAIVSGNKAEQRKKVAELMDVVGRAMYGRRPRCKRKI